MVVEGMLMRRMLEGLCCRSSMEEEKRKHNNRAFRRGSPARANPFHCHRRDVLIGESQEYQHLDGGVESSTPFEESIQAF